MGNRGSHLHENHDNNNDSGSSTSSTSVSPQQRAERIYTSTRILHEHLLESPPIVLPADLRWAIAEETRHCWRRCKACSTFYQKGHQHAKCQHSHRGHHRASRNGSQLFEDLQNVGHTFSDQVPFRVTGHASWTRVRNIGTYLQK